MCLVKSKLQKDYVSKAKRENNMNNDNNHCCCSWFKFNRLKPYITMVAWLRNMPDF